MKLFNISLAMVTFMALISQRQLQSETYDNTWPPPVREIYKRTQPVWAEPYVGYMFVLAIGRDSSKSPIMFIDRSVDIKSVSISDKNILVTVKSQIGDKMESFVIPVRLSPERSLRWEIIDNGDRKFIYDLLHPKTTQVIVQELPAPIVEVKPPVIKIEPPKIEPPTVTIEPPQVYVPEPPILLYRGGRYYYLVPREVPQAPRYRWHRRLYSYPLYPDQCR